MPLLIPYSVPPKTIIIFAETPVNTVVGSGDLAFVEQNFPDNFPVYRNVIPEAPISGEPPTILTSEAGVTERPSSKTEPEED
jgi:hypothetical protein